MEKTELLSARLEELMQKMSRLESEVSQLKRKRDADSIEKRNLKARIERVEDDNRNLNKDNRDLHARLDNAARVIRDLKMSFIDQCSDKQSVIPSTANHKFITCMVTQVREILMDYNASIDDKIMYSQIGEELIAKNLITEKQAGMLRKFIDTFNENSLKKGRA